MSRFDGDYEEDYPNQGALWENRAMLALRGRKGRAALAELREALEHLPEKRLVEGYICTVGLTPKLEADLANADSEYMRSVALSDLERLKEQGEGVCNVGAYVWWKRVKAGMTPEEAFASLPEGDSEYETAELGHDAGLAWSLAQYLAYENDESLAGLSPEARYDAMIKFIDSELARPPLQRAPRKIRKVRTRKAVPPRESSSLPLGL